MDRRDYLERHKNKNSRKKKSNTITVEGYTLINSIYATSYFVIVIFSYMDYMKTLQRTLSPS